MTALNVLSQTQQQTQASSWQKPLTTPSTSSTRPSKCQFCQFYQHRGHQGGYCQKLSTPVQSHWRSCPLALSPFAPSWEAQNGDVMAQNNL